MRHDNPNGQDGIPQINSRADRRAEQRLRLHRMVRIRLADGSGAPPFSACITELSPGGVGLVLQRGIVTGTEFELTVRDAEGIVTQLLYRATQCARLAGGGQFQVGATLVRVLRPTTGCTAAADVQRIQASPLAG